MKNNHKLDQASISLINLLLIIAGVVSGLLTLVVMGGSLPQRWSMPDAYSFALCVWMIASMIFVCVAFATNIIAPAIQKTKVVLKGMAYAASSFQICMLFIFWMQH